MEPYRSYFLHGSLLLPEKEKLTEKVLIGCVYEDSSPR
jgi:hypothetical protein